MASNDDLIVPIVILAFLYVVSIFYFHFVEGWSYLDAAYFTTITITTVGYGDLTPSTDYGKIGAILLSFFGVSLALYIITHLGRWRERTLDEKIRRRLDLIKYLTHIDSKKEKEAKKKLGEEHD